MRGSLSVLEGLGISPQVRSWVMAVLPPSRWRAIVGAFVVAVAVSGCELRGLARDELFGRADAAMDANTDDTATDRALDRDIAAAADAGAERDPEAVDAMDAAAAVDAVDAVVPVDAVAVADAVEVGDALDGGDALDVVGGGGVDAPVVATGNLSGTVSACGIRSNAPSAQIAIAGRRKCSFPDKGSYFFAALPAGRLRLAAVKDGFERFEADVVIDPAGTIFDIDLVPAAPYTCTDLPPKLACTCADPTCEP